MKKLILLLTLMFSFGVANAGELFIPLASKHILASSHSYKDRYNEINPGLIYQTDSNWMFGVFKNSYDAPTYLIGKHFSPFKNKNIGFDFGLSLYGNMQFKEKDRLSPIAQATYDIKMFRLGYAPMISDKSYGVFTLQIKIPIN